MSEQADRDALAEVLRGHRVVVSGTGHGWFTLCSCGAREPAADFSPDDHRADVVTDWLAQRDRRVAAKAWSEGHAAGRDFAGDGWNSDAHGPEDDNPYREDRP